MKVNTKELEISKYFFNRQIIQKCEKNTDISKTLKKEIDSGNTIQTVSNVNHDERTRLNKLRVISETMSVNETFRPIGSNQTISCLNEDIKYSTTSKEGLENQFIQQRDETNKANAQLNTETELVIKQTTASIETKDELTRTDELRELLEARAGEKKIPISRMNKEIKKIVKSKEAFHEQIKEKRNETSELRLRLKMEIESGNTIKSLPKENQDNITKLKVSGSWTKVIEEEKERTISYWKEDKK